MYFLCLGERLALELLSSLQPFGSISAVTVLVFSSTNLSLVNNLKDRNFPESLFGSRGRDFVSWPDVGIRLLLRLGRTIEEGANVCATHSTYGDVQHCLCLGKAFNFLFDWFTCNLLTPDWPGRFMLW